MPEWHTLEVDTLTRLDQLLARRWELLDHPRIREMVVQEAILINGQPARNQGQWVEPADEVRNEAVLDRYRASVSVCDHRPWVGGVWGEGENRAILGPHELHVSAQLRRPRGHQGGQHGVFAPGLSFDLTQASLEVHAPGLAHRHPRIASASQAIENIQAIARNPITASVTSE